MVWRYNVEEKLKDKLPVSTYRYKDRLLLLPLIGIVSPNLLNQFPNFCLIYGLGQYAPIVVKPDLDRSEVASQWLEPDPLYSSPPWSIQAQCLWLKRSIS